MTQNYVILILNIEQLQYHLNVCFEHSVKYFIISYKSNILILRIIHKLIVMRIQFFASKCLLNLKIGIRFNNFHWKLMNYTMK